MSEERCQGNHNHRKAKIALNTFKLEMRTETTCKNLINITSQPRHPPRYLLSCSHHSSSSRNNNNKSIDTCLVCWLIHMRFSIFISKMTLLIGCGNRTFRIKYRSESVTYKHVILIVLFSFVFRFFLVVSNSS